MSLAVWLYTNVDVGNAALTRLDVPETDMNYTHNVSPMWRKAGCYEALYEGDGKQAWEVLGVLREALIHMQTYPQEYTGLNPPNGWGDFGSAREWLGKLIDTWSLYPKAKIGVSK